MIADMETISYRRLGRKLRATGSVIEKDQKTRMTKVKPLREDWGTVWLAPAEIEAGKEKPPTRPREKRDQAETKPKRRKMPKPVTAPEPKWKRLVAEVRTLEIDHVPDGWPAVKMKTLSALADELESAHSKLAEFLPLNETSAAAGSEKECP